MEENARRLQFPALRQHRHQPVLLLRPYPCVFWPATLESHRWTALVRYGNRTNISSPEAIGMCLPTTSQTARTPRCSNTGVTDRFPTMSLCAQVHTSCICTLWPWTVA